MTAARQARFTLGQFLAGGLLGLGLLLAIVLTVFYEGLAPHDPARRGAAHGPGEPARRRADRRTLVAEGRRAVDAPGRWLVGAKGQYRIVRLICLPQLVTDPPFSPIVCPVIQLASFDAR